MRRKGRPKNKENVKRISQMMQNGRQRGGQKYTHIMPKVMQKDSKWEGRLQDARRETNNMLKEYKRMSNGERDAKGYRKGGKTRGYQKTNMMENGDKKGSKRRTDRRLKGFEMILNGRQT